MNLKGIFAVSTVFFMSQISTGSAIACYQCEEILGPQSQCANNVKKVLTANCTEYFSCIKYKMKDGNVTTIFRNCAPRNKCDVIKGSLTGSQTLSFCGTCNSTLCNSAQMTRAPLLIHSFWMVLYIMYTYSS
ncbi:unnamed protein product [Phaedon cochleariae]|uniref:Protein sleepless n=1 Tax=Phaedon cochleariae TaxID=80249 RepID=A0A9P0DHH0_PHACE|nr:unnamed protein product [Phaedon cochleariae]